MRTFENFCTICFLGHAVVGAEQIMVSCGFHSVRENLGGISEITT